MRCFCARPPAADARAAAEAAVAGEEVGLGGRRRGSRRAPLVELGSGPSRRPTRAARSSATPSSATRCTRTSPGCAAARCTSKSPHGSTAAARPRPSGGALARARDDQRARDALHLRARRLQHGARLPRRRPGRPPGDRPVARRRRRRAVGALERTRGVPSCRATCPTRPGPGARAAATPATATKRHPQAPSATSPACTSFRATGRAAVSGPPDVGRRVRVSSPTGRRGRRAPGSRLRSCQSGGEPRRAARPGRAPPPRPSKPAASTCARGRSASRASAMAKRGDSNEGMERIRAACRSLSSTT